MKYPLSPEALADAAKRNVRHMELDDLAAMKVCLLSTGALLGLSCKGRLSRRLMGLTCSFLAAGPSDQPFSGRAEARRPCL